MNAAPSQRPHPLFSWLIPKELINMHEAAISIGTKDGACTLALWRSIRNTKGLLRGKLSVSLALGWVDAQRTHTSKKKKKRYAQSIHNTPHTHRERQTKSTHSIHTHTPEGPDKAAHIQTQSQRCKADVYRRSRILSILLFPPFFFFSPPNPSQYWVCNEFENWPISFALTEMSLSGGGGGRRGSTEAP